MKRLKKLIMFFRPIKRLRTRIDMLELRIKRDNEALTRPVFRVEYGPDDSESFLQVGVRALLDLKQSSIMGLVKLANHIYEDNSNLDDLTLYLETDLGVFTWQLGEDAEREITDEQHNLKAVVKFPRIEAGQTVKILNAYIVYDGAILKDMPKLGGMRMLNGDALNVQYTFNAP
jgi:hypothetical protein